MTNAAKELYEFGAFAADASERRILRDGKEVPLTAKAFDVLLVLLRSGGATVTRERFLAEVWAGTIVEEANLSDNISILVRRDPNYVIAHDLLWAVYREAGDDDRSVAARIVALRLYGFPESVLLPLEASYRGSGIEEYRRREVLALELQSHERYIPAVIVAMNHAQNGDGDAAFGWLERAYRERSGWLVELESDPVWDPLRGDPRFTALVAKVNAR